VHAQAVALQLALLPAPHARALWSVRPLLSQLLQPLSYYTDINPTCSLNIHKTSVLSLCGLGLGA
jgi:hypothetical protein